jgi:hypothetical protein
MLGCNGVNDGGSRWRNESLISAYAECGACFSMSVLKTDFGLFHVSAERWQLAGGWFITPTSVAPT